MTVYETQILIQNEKVRKIQNEIIRLLNDLHEKFDFNRAELLLAFNEVMLVQWDIESIYLRCARID